MIRRCSDYKHIYRRLRHQSIKQQLHCPSGSFNLALQPEKSAVGLRDLHSSRCFQSWTSSLVNKNSNDGVNTKNHALRRRSRRPFATSRQKRLQKEQGVKGRESNEETQEKPKMRSNIAKPPTSLIRTDFASGTSGTAQDLILPSGYELPFVDGNISQQFVNYKELYDPQVHLPSAPLDWSDYEPATPLWDELAAQIGVVGRPLTVAEFMQQALLHPKYGYYSQPSRDNVEDSDEDDWGGDAWDINEDQDRAKHDDTFNPIFGPRGDFVTAPEICQVFGESIQVWMVTQWEAMGRPSAYQMVEFGPGRGTLMADMVRFALTHDDKLQEYGSGLKAIHLIEGSEPLRQQQEATLREQVGQLVNWEFYNPNKEAGMEQPKNIDSAKPTIRVYWHESFASVSAMVMRQKQQRSESSSSVSTDPTDVSTMPLFMVCQEFFDALPVHAFEMTEEGWRERMIDVAIRDELLEDEGSPVEKSQSETTSKALEGKKRPRLRVVLAPEVTPALKTLMNVDDDGKTASDMTSDRSLKVGDIVEVCPEGILLVQDIASLIQQQGGAALIIDYGEEGSADSLRGFWKHEQAHFLSLPGQTDVTADVDFTALKHAINHSRPDRLLHQAQGNDGTNKSDANIRAYGPISQGKFLVAMGARERVIHSIESDSTTDEEAEQLYYALERLVAPELMGLRYKVLSIAPERKNVDNTFTVSPAGF